MKHILILIMLFLLSGCITNNIDDKEIMKVEGIIIDKTIFSYYSTIVLCNDGYTVILDGDVYGNVGD